MNVLFEFPIEHKMRKRLRVPANLARTLLVAANKDELPALAEYIFGTRAEDQALLAQSILCFKSVEQLKELMSDHDLGYWTDAEILGKPGNGRDIVVHCESAAEIELMLGLDAEGMVFYSAPIIDGAIRVRPNIVAQSAEGTFQHNFLALRPDPEIMSFFEANPPAIEVFGPPERLSAILQSLAHLWMMPKWLG